MRNFLYLRYEWLGREKRGKRNPETYSLKWKHKNNDIPGIRYLREIHRSTIFRGKFRKSLAKEKTRWTIREL